MKKGYKVIKIKYLKLNSNSSDLQKHDFEKLVLLYGAELDNHQNRITPKEILTKWANSMINIQGDTDRHLELCYNGDSLIGFLYGKIDHPDHKGYIKVGHGYIMEFYVLPEFRRSGYGKQMYSHLEELLIMDGAKGLYLTSDPVTGKPFWLACGYIMEFYVLPEFRRNGYGKQMYSHLEELLISDGAKGLYLTSDPVTGKPFWLACGYISTGEQSPENNQEIYEKSL